MYKICPTCFEMLNIGEIEGEATTMKDAVAIVLAKYGGRKETING